MLNMPCQYLSSSPEFWIKDYYERLINKIDIFIETELEKEIKNSKDSNPKKIDYFNQLRNDFLNEITQVEQDNFKQIKLNYKQIEAKLDSAKSKQNEILLSECIEEIKANDICKRHCFLINVLEENLIYLVSCDFYVTELEAEILKY